MALRSSWEGYLKLNLLSVPVKAYSTAISGRGKISFHQIHADCGQRIRHQKVCPIHGEVTKDEVVAGYEVSKGQYVLVDPQELNELRPEDEKAIAIEVFLHRDALDPIYCTGRHYYLTPDGKVGQKPYAVLQRVMSEQERHAIAQVVFSGRRQLALLRPVKNLLTMTLLSYDEQVKKPSAFQDELDDATLSPKEVSMAESLIDASTVEEFDIAQYHDEYESELTQLIEAKSKGKKIASSRRTTEEPGVINLMDALKKSLNQAQKGGKKRAVHRVSHRRKTG